METHEKFVTSSRTKLTSRSSAIRDRDARHLVPVYARYEAVMERGEGVYLFDVDGNRYLDMMAGLGVNALGHAHPRMLAAMADQAAKIVHLSPQYSNPNPGLLAERLCDKAGMAAAFFSTGGSEAVEGALKLARTYGRQICGQLGGASKHHIVALRNSYHGRTFGSMSVTGQTKYSADFGPGLPDITFVDRNDIAGLDAAVDSQTCAILLEPILGEGGVHPCSREFLEAARLLADRHRALLIFDEIQTGLGRTGGWFAFEATGVRPDAVILGKPLGGGLPLSALLVSDALVHCFGLAKHGSTLGGSPMACRLGLEFLSIVEDERLLERVRRTGEHLAHRLASLAEEFDVIQEARGEGLMQALELSIPARPLVEAALARGVMLNCVQGNVIRFLPPLVVEPAHIDHALDVLHDVLEQVSTKRHALHLEAMAS